MIHFEISLWFDISVQNICVCACVFVVVWTTLILTVYSCKNLIKMKQNKLVYLLPKNFPKTAKTTPIWNFTSIWHSHCIFDLIMLILSTTFWNAISITRINFVVFLLLAVVVSFKILLVVLLLDRVMIRIFKHCFPCWMAMNLSVLHMCACVCICMCMIFFVSLLEYVGFITAFYWLMRKQLN